MRLMANRGNIVRLYHWSLPHTWPFSNNNDDTICHDNTISHNDTYVLMGDFNSYQAKCIKEPQNVKDAFLKKLSDIEQNLWDMRDF